MKASLTPDEEKLFTIAKHVDNEYMSKRDNFEVTRKPGYYYIRTNSVDRCSFIRVYCDPFVMTIEKIEVNGEWTNGWQKIHKETFDRVNNALTPGN